MLYGIDLETECDVPDCPGNCEHALDPNRNRITVAAISDGDKSWVFRGTEQEIINSIDEWLTTRTLPLSFTAHEGKFDFKNLKKRGLDLTASWTDDSCLLAYICLDKIPDYWLNDYEQQRQLLNKSRTRPHREAKHHSLKTLAPFFLGVEPFWEPESHDNDDYVVKDAAYAVRLTKLLRQKVEEQGGLQFYEKHQLPWSKMLMEAELDGVLFDDKACIQEWKESERNQLVLADKIKEQWQDSYNRFKEQQELDLKLKYEQMTAAAIEKKTGLFDEALSITPEKLEKIKKRYAKLYEEARPKIRDLSIDSPTQLLWLLKDRGLDPRNWEGEESTDKESLNKLASSSKEVELLLAYRKEQKLCTTYFPEYLRYQERGKIYCSYNVIGTRTGRISCNNPNLQQVPPKLRGMFKPSPGSKFIVKDLSAIEPTLLAYFSEDHNLCNLMLNDGDFHSTNAVTMFNLDCSPSEVKELHPTYRKTAKEIGLAILYGAGGKRVKQVLDKHGLSDYSEQEAKDMVYNLRGHYEGVWTFKTNLDAELEAGGIVYNLLGRPIKINNVEDVYMKGLNRLIQSSASDLLLESGLLAKERSDLIKPLLFVHDEVVCEVPAHNAELLTDLEKVIDSAMCHWDLPTEWGNLQIKTEGGVYDNWTKG